MDIEGQQDQHTPLGTATACISERVAPGVQYGATWTEVEEPPGNRKPKGTVKRGNAPFWLPRCLYSFAVWPPHKLQRANCGLQRANCVSCDGPITWRGAVTTATKVRRTHQPGWPGPPGSLRRPRARLTCASPRAAEPTAFLVPPSLRTGPPGLLLGLAALFLHCDTPTPNDGWARWPPISCDLARTCSPLPPHRRRPCSHLRRARSDQDDQPADQAGPSHAGAHDGHCTLPCRAACAQIIARAPLVVASARVAHVMSLAKRNSRACTLDLLQA